MRNECNIIRDILPLYAEKIVSEDTAAFVEEHLEHCEGCSAELENMKNPEKIVFSASVEEDARRIKNLRRKINAKKIAVGILSAVSTAALFIGFSFTEVTVGGTDFSVVFLGILGAAIFFGVQCLFFRAKSKTVRLLPVFATAIGFLLCGMMYIGVFGSWSGGFLGNVNRIFAIVFGVILLIAAFGETAAWAFRWFRKKNSD